MFWPPPPAPSAVFVLGRHRWRPGGQVLPGRELLDAPRGARVLGGAGGGRRGAEPLGAVRREQEVKKQKSSQRLSVITISSGNNQEELLRRHPAPL